MSDMKASVTRTGNGFHVEGYEVISHDFSFCDDVFNVANEDLAALYRGWGRVLAVMDKNVHNLYGAKMRKYFEHHNLDLTIHQTQIGEKAKTIPTFESIVDAMTDFGIIRKEPVLVVGGGLVTDVAGFACAAYRRNTNYVRIPTTLIGLIDASVSIKVAVNHNKYKNRLGAYHAPVHTFLDFTFLRTLPTGQIRNGFAELIKISSCASLQTFDLLDQFCEKLIETGFGRTDGAEKEVHDAADKINVEGIHVMLKLETPNLHEIGLDRVIAYGHTWSPLHELVPEPPLRHGHAISIDMAFSATLAHHLGKLDTKEHRRLLNLFSRAGLSMDHETFTPELLEKATAAILKTRDGKLRAAVPSPLGSCVFLNDVTKDVMDAALKEHKRIVAEFPRQGAGLDAYVDASDTGYTDNDCGCAGTADAPLDGTAEGLPVKATKEAIANANGHTNGHAKVNGQNGVNGHTNGVNGVNGHQANGVEYQDTVNGSSGYNMKVIGDLKKSTAIPVDAGSQ